MDYLIFVTSLLLVAASCALVLLRRGGKGRGGMAVALGLVALALPGWLGLVDFAFGTGMPMPLVKWAAGTLMVVAFGVFQLIAPGLWESPRKWMLWVPPLILTTAAVVAGARDDARAWGLVPMAFGAIGGGWALASALGMARGTRWCMGVALGVVALVQLLPDAVDGALGIGAANAAVPKLWMDVALWTGLGAAAFVAWSVWCILVRRMGERSPRRSGLSFRLVAVAVGLSLAYGAVLSYWLGNLALDEKRTALLKTMRLGALGLDDAEIETLKGTAAEVTTDTFRSQHAQLGNLADALPQTRFVYLVGQRNGHIVFLVDAEDPASPDFSPPGMLYEYQPQKWREALEGKEHFGGPDADPWGVWFTAILPIKSPASGKIVAALGVDYPASQWLQPIAARRLAAMGVTLMVVFLLLALLAFALIASEKDGRVDQLSANLSDALAAADMDIWEWIVSEGTVVTGSRMAAAIGGHRPGNRIPFLRIWRSIHPAERYAVRQLFRQSRSGRDFHEVEIRLAISGGEYVWYSVRGRVVKSDARGHGRRLTGTILNIDSKHRARLEIEKQRRFASKVMEAVPVGVAAVDIEGVISYANSAFGGLASLLPGALVGKFIRELIPGFAELDPGGTEIPFAGEGCGSPVIVRASKTDLREAGEWIGSIVSLVDLTSVRRTEQELRSSREEAARLALVATSTDNTVVLADSQGRVEWVNESFSRASGYEREEVVGLPLAGLLQGRDSDPRTAAMMEERIAAGAGFECEIMNYAKGGRPFIAAIECQTLADASGHLAGFAAIGRDVTRSRRSARLLEAVAAVSTTLLSSVQIGEALWRPVLERLVRATGTGCGYLCQFIRPEGGGKVIRIAEWQASWNGLETPPVGTQKALLAEHDLAAWLELLSRGSEIEGVAASFPDSQRRVLEARGVHSIILLPVFAGGELWGVLGLDSYDPHRTWEDWEIALLKSAAANVGLRLAAEHESDVLRTTRDQARKAAAEADRANRAKTTFLATMSHEIRTPLNAVIGMASLLETTPLSSSQREQAETILHSSHFLLELINDILDYSRIESGKIELDHAPFVLMDICQGAFDVVKGSARDKMVEAVCEIDPALPPAFRGDGARLRQILVNLLGNAFKFTSKGHVTLAVRGRPAKDGAWNLDFEVSDSGIGIAPEAIERLFKPFTQEDSSTTRRFGGSGLGLAICKRLVDLMDGDISVSSTQGAGSTFHVSVILPVEREQVVSKSRVYRLPDGWRPRTLIVDDNDVNRRILREILARLGIFCTEAAGAGEAVERWNGAGPFEVAILDYHMPDANGSETVKRLRALPGAESCKFLLIGSENPYRPEVRELFDGVVSKPIWPASVESLLAGISGSGGLAPGAGPARPAAGLHGMKVLVAEDNRNNQKVLRMLLRQLGIDPDIVENGELAVQAARERPYDAILMDVQMPVMDGLEAARILSGDPPPGRLCIIALTANAFREDREAALEAGMDHYLSKPVTLDALQAALSSARYEGHPC
ncbi:response regulator [Luteolibacter sp. LG18]|uniref:response regulator n=1 Tax=Luteolibacter sp. LG18 TaxID=2819286 RepID=UPI002B2FA3EA|nr:hypothetical protein llg_42850 [Luteolibacter sp. LG18]